MARKTMKVTKSLADDIRQKFGESTIVTFRNHKYITIGEPWDDIEEDSSGRYIDVCTCPAIEIGEISDEDKIVHEYYVYWEVRSKDKKVFTDWGHPMDVREEGSGFDVENLEQM